MKFNSSTLVIMAALMIAPAIILETSMFDSDDSCDMEMNTKINLATGEVDFAPFDAVNTSGAVKVELTQGASESVVLEGEEEYFENIIVETRGTTLHIRTKPNLKDHGDVLILVTYDDLKDLRISGASKVSLEGKKLPNDFDLAISGASKVSVGCDFEELDLHVSGASKVKLQGNTDEGDYSISGASKVEAEGMDFDDLDVNASGAAHVRVGKGNSLTVRASGAAHVEYVDAKEISRKSSGAASISKS